MDEGDVEDLKEDGEMTYLNGWIYHGRRSTMHAEINNTGDSFVMIFLINTIAFRFVFTALFFILLYYLAVLLPSIVQMHLVPPCWIGRPHKHVTSSFITVHGFSFFLKCAHSKHSVKRAQWRRMLALYVFKKKEKSCPLCCFGAGCAFAGLASVACLAF